MVQTGLDNFESKILPHVRDRKTGIVCHAPSINSAFKHIIDIFHDEGVSLSSVFGPQHGMFGQTQDNMIEWEGYLHPKLNIPVHSLYGRRRKPTKLMLKETEILVVDLQDVGARPYTYAWTMKYCMEACSEYDIELLIIDRPNPLGGIRMDGAVLKRDYFTFVGGAEIPLCHGMTMGELALWLNEKENIDCSLTIVGMEGWDRRMMYDDTGLPWVLPSPNMPSLKTAMVYPGMVLVEALKISEGRGTCLPFELCGAPFLDIEALINELNSMKIPGCAFRQHNFIPTFHKFADQYCEGIQIHVTDFESYEPVYTAACIFKKIIETRGQLEFKDPPYEYEEVLMPFDILSGDDKLRKVLTGNGSMNIERERWRDEIEGFKKQFKDYILY